MRPPTSASRHEEMAFESTFEDRCMPRRASAAFPRRRPQLTHNHPTAAGPTRCGGRLQRAERTHAVVPTVLRVVAVRLPPRTNGRLSQATLSQGCRSFHQDAAARKNGASMAVTSSMSQSIVFSFPARVTYHGHDFRPRMVRTCRRFMRDPSGSTKLTQLTGMGSTVRPAGVQNQAPVSAASGCGSFRASTAKGDLVSDTPNILII